MTRRRHGLAPALAAVSAVAFLLLPATADAHAYLLRTDPPDGSRFDSSPGQIRLGFSENVSAKLSRVKLTGARGGEVSGLRVSGSGTSLVVSLPRLARDTYSLYWLTTSTDDLHITRGTTAFSVGVGTAAPLPAGEARPAPSRPAAGTDAGEVALRWLDFAAIAGLLGALSLLAVCGPRAAARGAIGLEAVQRRLVRLAVVSAVVALAAGVGLLLDQARGFSALGAVLGGTSYGSSWIARELLVGVLLALAPALGRRRPGVPLAALAALAALGLCVALALGSHSAAARGHVSLATAALALHLLAAAVWAGGVGGLVLVLVGARRARHGHAAGLLLRSFGGIAALGVATVAVTGLYSAGVDVDSPGELVTTFYGRTLLIKTGLFLAVGAAGLANSMLVRATAPGRPLPGRSVRLEAGLAAGVLLLAAVLTSSAPAQGRRLAAPVAPAASSAADALASTQAGDLLVTLSVKPNRPGVNFVTAGVFDTRRPAPGPIRTVELSLGADGRWTKATPVRAGYWQLTGRRARAGPWSIAIRVGRPGLPARLATIRWGLPGPSPPPPAPRTVAGHSLAAIVTPLSAALGLLLLLLVPLVMRAGRRRRLPGAPLRRASGRLGSPLDPVEAARATRE